MGILPVKTIMIVFTLGLMLVACTNTSTNKGLLGPTSTVFIYRVIVATKDLPSNTVITPSMVAYCTWSLSQIPELGVARMEDVVGRTTRTFIHQGSPILDNQLTDMLPIHQTLSPQEKTDVACPSNSSTP
jgi:Flp pilus assembly protein CpaB